MKEMLYSAAISGNIGALNQLLQEDPLILDKSTLQCSSNKTKTSPLHIAAMFGHVDFVRAILNLCSDMILNRDRDGRNPLHIAAIKGKREVLEVLIKFRPLVTWERSDGGGTLLHLCMKYNQLENLKMVVDNVNDSEFINAKNDEGMTILHLAVLDKQFETIQYLVENNININAKNANGKTALDMFAGDMNSEIGTFLRNSGALKAEEIAESKSNTRHENAMNGTDWLAKKRDSIMVVASLIATMAFQAGVNPAGGVWQEDLLVDSQGSNSVPNPHRAGEAVMAHSHPKSYRYLLRANTIAFVSSLSTILLLISGLPFKNKLFMWFLMVVMWLTITTIALSYGISIVMITPKDIRKPLSHVIQIAVIVWSSVMSLLLLGNTLRLINRWLKGHGIEVFRRRKITGNSDVQDHGKDKVIALRIQ